MYFYLGTIRDYRGAKGICDKLTKISGKRGWLRVVCYVTKKIKFLLLLSHRNLKFLGQNK